MSVAKKIAAAAITLTAAVSGASQAEATEYVTNGGFETGDFTGWTVQGQSWTVTSNPSNVDQGNFSAQNGCVGVSSLQVGSPSACFIEQSFSLFAGNTYALSFDYSPQPGNEATAGTPNEVDVYIDNTLQFQLVNLLNPSYQTYTADFVALGGGLDNVAFYTRQDPSGLGIDQISVTDSSVPVGTPAPDSTAIFTGVLAMIGFAARDRLKQRLATAANSDRKLELAA